MAYNKRIMLKSKKQWIWLSVFFIFGAIVIYEGYQLYHYTTNGKAVIASDADNKSNSNTILVAQTKYGMNQGELLDVSKVEMVKVPAEMAPVGAITSLSKLNNMRLKQKVAEKELLKDLDLMPEAAAFEEGDRLIEHCFAEGSIPATVVLGSEIDIKLFIKGGEDSVVVSKAVVISRNANLLSFYMNKKEQEFLKEAATEGMLFAVQYLDASQKASDTTYATSYGRGGGI